jgi:hypothetical protein
MRENKSLVTYWDIKKEYRRELYIHSYNMAQTKGIAQFTWDIWKLRGTRRTAEKGRCPLCNEENKIHTLQKVKDT